MKTSALTQDVPREFAAMPGSAGIAYSHAVPQPGMAKAHYKSDYQRYQAAWHAAHCQIENCDWCQSLCDQGLVIACDECGHVHHTDWLGWIGDVDDDGRCTVLCPECQPNDKTLATGGAATRSTEANQPKNED